MNEIEISTADEMVSTSETISDIVSQAQKQAKALIDIVEQQKLYQTIRGRKFLNMEAWQILGTFTGLTAKVEWSKKIETDKEIAYEARVVITNRDDKEISAGESECRSTEEGKSWMSHNQIRSMAQTRALSKAYRLKLAFIARLAGYEPTPAEEISESEFPGEETQASTPKTVTSPKPRQASPKSEVSKPKTKSSAGVTSAQCTVVKKECLKYVSQKLFDQISDGLGIKGKKASEITMEDLRTLRDTCENFQEQEVEVTKEEEPIEPLNLGKEEEEDVESKDTENLTF